MYLLFTAITSRAPAIFKATPYAASPLSDRACLLSVHPSVRPSVVVHRDEMIVGP
jgi:hypothetical protein